MKPEELKRHRLAYPLSHDELAALVGVNYSTIGHWEAGRRTPRPRAVRKLQAIFGLRPWSEVEILPLCATCGIVPPARQRTECGACHMQRWRASKHLTDHGPDVEGCLTCERLRRDLGHVSLAELERQRLEAMP